MLTQLKPEVMPIDKFTRSLRAICGGFDVIPASNRDTVRGHVSRGVHGGLEMAMIAQDVLRTRRTVEDVKANPGKHVFLIIQEEGQALMQQAGAPTLMRPGDMILIDSTQPAEFTSFGKYMRHLSVHLDRCELVERFGDVSFGGRSIQNDDRYAFALSAIFGSAFQANTSEQQPFYLKEALLGVLGAVLNEKRDMSRPKSLGAELGSPQLLEQAMACIDRRFADSTMSPGQLAKDLGVSIRNLQRAFTLAGVTPTDYLLRRRLERASQLLVERRRTNARTLVSTIAFESGFNDVSYFNRQFRRMFRCSPGQYPNS